jgi:hypothetical protein
MTSGPRSVEEVIAEGYPVKTTQYLRQGWESFKRYPAGFIGFALILTVVSQGLPLLNAFIGQFLSITVQVIMMAGVALVVWKQSRQQTTEFTDFFPDWNTVGRLILVTMVGLFLIGVGLALLVLPGIYLIVAYTFSYLLVTERGLAVWPALETSRRVVAKNWWGVAGLVGMLLLLTLGGAVVGSLIFGLPLGSILAGYYPKVSLSDLPFGPAQSTVLINMGLMVGIISGGMLGLGIGMALAGCMLSVAYSDIFGLTDRQTSVAEGIANHAHTVPS